MSIKAHRFSQQSRPILRHAGSHTIDPQRHGIVDGTHHILATKYAVAKLEWKQKSIPVTFLKRETPVERFKNIAMAMNEVAYVGASQKLADHVSW